MSILYPPAEQQLDPYGFYAERRRLCPLVYDEGLRAWGFYRHADVKALLSDPEKFSSQRLKRLTRGAARESLLSTDPPRHRKLRNLAMQAFTPRAVAEMAPRIERLTEHLLASVRGESAFDLIGQLAHPLPVIVIAAMLGVPLEDRARFRRWADAIVTSAPTVMMLDEEAPIQRLPVQNEMDAYFRAIIEARRRAPQADLISQLIEAEVDGERLTEDELFSFCILLLMAGHITTVNLISYGMLALLDHPDQEALLREQPDAMPSAVEEMLRYCAPVQHVSRIVAHPCEFAGQPLEKDQIVIGFIASANRDAAVFPDPEHFDVLRHPNPHLGFGHGIHFCLGAPLARLEAQIAIRALLAHFPELRVLERPSYTPESLAALSGERLGASLLPNMASFPLAVRAKGRVG